MSLTNEQVIPVVDFENCSLKVKDEDVNIQCMKTIGEEICRAFRSIGFVYIMNHGIEEEKIQYAMNKLKAFVQLPEKSKEKFSRTVNGYGWLAAARESLNPAGPHDLKESFSYLPRDAKTLPSCDSEVSGFDECVSEMYSLCYKLSQRILYATGIGLNLDDPHYLCKQHNPYTEKCLTTMRMLYYPPVPDLSVIQPGQLRCGEHSDWGTITLLLQDSAGGLQVMADGKFVDATPIPGTILVNIGDLLQRWTDDALVSTVHRVVLPSDEASRHTVRQSIAFFVDPDDESVVSSLFGSDKYPPIKTRDYFDMKFKACVA